MIIYPVGYTPDSIRFYAGLSQGDFKYIIHSKVEYGRLIKGWWNHRTQVRKGVKPVSNFRMACRDMMGDAWYN